MGATLVYLAEHFRFTWNMNEIRGIPDHYLWRSPKFRINLNHPIYLAHEPYKGYFHVCPMSRCEKYPFFFFICQANLDHPCVVAEKSIRPRLQSTGAASYQVQHHTSAEWNLFIHVIGKHFRHGKLMQSILFSR